MVTVINCAIYSYPGVRLIIWKKHLWMLNVSYFFYEPEGIFKPRISPWGWKKHTSQLGVFQLENSHCWGHHGTSWHIMAQVASDPPPTSHNISSRTRYQYKKHPKHHPPRCFCLEILSWPWMCLGQDNTSWLNNSKQQTFTAETFWLMEKRLKIIQIERP